MRRAVEEAMHYKPRAQAAAASNGQAALRERHIVLDLIRSHYGASSTLTSLAKAPMVVLPESDSIPARRLLHFHGRPRCQRNSLRTSSRVTPTTLGIRFDL